MAKFEPEIFLKDFLKKLEELPESRKDIPIQNIECPTDVSTLGLILEDRKLIKNDDGVADMECIYAMTPREILAITSVSA